jgi:alanyl-tRNA synthetase
MMIADGIIPSNEGRGYVLRRLLRRAARFGRMLGVEGTFLHEIAAVVVAESSQAYPELTAKKDYLQRVIRTEEERFAETILQGLGILSSHMEAARSRGERVLAGTDVFQLHDTYGFPLDLTREIASENDLDVDEAGFRTEMEAQKRKAREALKEKTGSAWGADALPQGLAPDFRTKFSGYEKLSLEATAVFLVRQGEAGEGPSVTECANAGDRVIAIFDETPFYAESGGQVGDTGTISSPGFTGMVEDTHRTPDGKYLHTLLVTEGTLSMGDVIRGFRAPTCHRREPYHHAPPPPGAPGRTRLPCRPIRLHGHAGQASIRLQALPADDADREGRGRTTREPCDTRRLQRRYRGDEPRGRSPYRSHRAFR